MKTKLYTAMITADSLEGEIIVEDYLDAKTFTNEFDAQDWLTEKESEVYRNIPREKVVVYADIKEQEVDIPVFVCINVDYKNNDENCGLLTEAFPTKQEAINNLKESVKQELDEKNITDEEIDWHTHNGKYGMDAMPADPEIVDTDRFGWVIEEY